MENTTQKVIQILNTVTDMGKYIWNLTMERSCISWGRVKVNGQEYISANKNIPDCVLHSVTFHEMPTGIYLFVYEDGKYIEMRYISHYNTNSFHPEMLALYQEFGLEPESEDGKKCLKEEIKAEKIKETLVYYCYENAPQKIQKWLEKPKKTQLNAVMNGYGTPLIICTLHNDLESFKRIVEAGANLNKESCGVTPLQSAMKYSSDIVRYIYENHFEQFDKEVKRWGFAIASDCEDVQILELMKEYGCEIECEGDQYPPFHCFVDADNVVGMKFLVDNGISTQILNKYKQTPLDRAIRMNKKKAKAWLEENGEAK